MAVRMSQDNRHLVQDRMMLAEEGSHHTELDLAGPDAVPVRRQACCLWVEAHSCRLLPAGSRIDSLHEVAQKALGRHQIAGLGSASVELAAARIPGRMAADAKVGLLFSPGNCGSF